MTGNKWYSYLLFMRPEPLISLTVILYSQFKMKRLSDYNKKLLQNYHKRGPSVTVREEWKVLDDGEMDFPRLSKLHLPNVEGPEDLYVYKCTSCNIVFDFDCFSWWISQYYCTI